MSILAAPELNDSRGVGSPLGDQVFHFFLVHKFISAERPKRSEPSLIAEGQFRDLSFFPVRVVLTLGLFESHHFPHDSTTEPLYGSLDSLVISYQLDLDSNFLQRENFRVIDLTIQKYLDLDELGDLKPIWITENIYATNTVGGTDTLNLTLTQKPEFGNILREIFYDNNVPEVYSNNYRKLYIMLRRANYRFSRKRSFLLYMISKMMQSDLTSLRRRFVIGFDQLMSISSAFFSLITRSS